MPFDKEAYNARVHKGGASYGQDWQDHYSAIIKLVPSDSYILDIGCGRCGLLQYLRDKKNCRVMGLDVTSDAVSFGKEKGIEVIKCDIEEDEVDGLYDVIILSAILEHLIDPISVLERLRRNLRDGGCIVILVPNFSHLYARFLYLLGKNITAFGMPGEDVGFEVQPYAHLRFYNKAALSHILDRTGYRPIEWIYHKESHPEYSKASPLRMLLRWLFRKLYSINHPLFSINIAVKAVRL